MPAWFYVAPEGSIMYDAGNMLLFQFKPGTSLTLKQKAVWAWTITKWIFKQPTPVKGTNPPPPVKVDLSVN